MPYLIDGSNLIGNMSSLELSDPQSKLRLVAQLLKFQTVKKTKIILVFDGPQDPDLAGKNSPKKKFTVLWPDREDSADTIIKQRIEKQTDLRHFYVVSSDREIKDFARVNGAKVIDCKDFHKLLKTTLREYKESRALEKEDSNLSRLQVDHWLEIFGVTDE